MTEKKPVTIWQRWNKDKQRYEHNHIEDGHMHTFRPVPQSAEQRKAWEHAQWNRKWAYMDEKGITSC
jgi:hypothetical protein